MAVLKVVKIGGNIIDNEIMLQNFLLEFSKIKGPRILIHGGGKLATQLANKMQVEVNMVDGRRVTDAITLDIATMVYAGKINKNIVAKLQANNCNAIGLSGADGNCVISKKRPVKTIDYGLVGDVVKVNIEILELLLHSNITPVFCAITHDKQGQLLNTNADTVASEIAIGLANVFETELYYCFGKNGVLEDVNNEDSVIETITTERYKGLKEKGIIANGMLPKLNNCFRAIQNNIKTVCIGKPEIVFNKTLKYTTIQK
ncbi:acetylglutamate kinase [uncultured Lacinutrix sp.]|uniref:acetylglutamate kinase n=1 Tax=uncultured Lacinutrix sp. TaxID=574032 RepID=UPI002606B835|nr:acetylglutamate kinase [uncultured Lacinutrix sp.]